MLDLEAGVRFDKGEVGFITGIGIDQKLEGAEDVIFRGFGDTQSGVINLARSLGVIPKLGAISISF